MLYINTHICTNKFMYNKNKEKQKRQEKNKIQVFTMSVIEIILLFWTELQQGF